MMLDGNPLATESSNLIHLYSSSLVYMGMVCDETCVLMVILRHIISQSLHLLSETRFSTICYLLDMLGGTSYPPL
jgi:hypothetical protein